jgi:hypothetical protein
MEEILQATLSMPLNDRGISDYVSVCPKKIKKNVQIKKKEIYNDKYRHTRDSNKLKYDK